MAIEMTGTIKATTERVTDVSDDLEYSAAYEVKLQLDLDHRTFLALKRMELGQETVRVVLEVAQPEPLMPLPGVLDELYSLVMEVLTLDQSCAECDSGVHPPLHSGLYGILNSLGWLLGKASDAEVVGGLDDGAFLDMSTIRRVAVAALPAFAHLTYISESEDLYRELGAHHLEFRNLIDMLDQWRVVPGNHPDV